MNSKRILSTVVAGAAVTAAAFMLYTSNASATCNTYTSWSNTATCDTSDPGTANNGESKVAGPGPEYRTTFTVGTLEATPCPAQQAIVCYATAKPSSGSKTAVAGATLGNSSSVKAGFTINQHKVSCACQIFPE